MEKEKKMWQENMLMEGKINGKRRKRETTNFIDGKYQELHRLKIQWKPRKIEKENVIDNSQCTMNNS